ncbi:MAG: YqeG family HAD IIIA-type phosphatase [Firmicutes bacterium]|jgi:HAD superfamily phosphatase (TIGR01668 family)|nr:YqeG family HAD IIIA-type phosphatase [Bacillota bacterium]MDH7495619.1 YqeG family HAD IIIA-type phosphatase [Bacillota bacterium]
MGLLSLLCPDLYVPSIYRVDLSRLTDRGIRGLVLDIDNTFVDWGSADIPAGVLAFLDDAKARGIRVCVLSNNLRRRIEAISRALGIPAARGIKPMRSAFRAALGVLGTSPNETAVIGDQIFTDILGGNLLGMYTILVVPTSRREFVTTRAVRKLERAVLRCLTRRGMLSLESCESRAPGGAEHPKR